MDVTVAWLSCCRCSVGLPAREPAGHPSMLLGNVRISPRRLPTTAPPIDPAAALLAARVRVIPAAWQHRLGHC
eukprot:4950069-Alexandrium_andersonii.AAC.1